MPHHPRVLAPAGHADPPPAAVRDDRWIDLVTVRGAHAVPYIRAHVTAVLRTWQVPVDVVDDAALLVSELVTNAVHHGSGPSLRVRTRRQGHTLRCQVHDDGPGTPTARPVPHARPVPTEEGGLLAEHGRGLHLVEVIATRWGSFTDTRLPRGQHVVWFELETPASPAAPPGPTR
jgi:anti-sigma regulatory factor (Ser/Thr protein kinase)